MAQGSILCSCSSLLPRLNLPHPFFLTGSTSMCLIGPGWDECTSKGTLCSSSSLSCPALYSIRYAASSYACGEHTTTSHSSTFCWHLDRGCCSSPLEVSLGPSPALWQGLSPFGLGFWNRLNTHFLTHSLFHCFFLLSSELERYTGQSTVRVGYLRNSFSMQPQNKFFN